MSPSPPLASIGEAIVRIVAIAKSAGTPGLIALLSVGRHLVSMVSAGLAQDLGRWKEAMLVKSDAEALRARAEACYIVAEAAKMANESRRSAGQRPVSPSQAIAELNKAAEELMRYGGTIVVDRKTLANEVGTMQARVTKQSTLAGSGTKKISAPNAASPVVSTEVTEEPLTLSRIDEEPLTIAGLRFTHPSRLDTLKPPAVGGIYLVLEAKLVVEAGSGGVDYRPLYVGQTENFLSRGFPEQHQAHGSWVKEASPSSVLVISIFPMPNASESDRRDVEAVLCQVIDPPCNRIQPPSANS